MIRNPKRNENTCNESKVNGSTPTTADVKSDNVLVPRWPLYILLTILYICYICYGIQNNSWTALMTLSAILMIPAIFCTVIRLSLNLYSMISDFKEFRANRHGVGNDKKD